MATDPYTATWVSYSSISDFLACQKSYYYKNIYREPTTGHKVKIVSPPLSLGQVVHEVLDRISTLKKEIRFAKPLLELLDDAWKKVRGKKGGFLSEDAELDYKARAEKMIQRVIAHPGPLKEYAVKIPMELPHYWLSEKENIILCGKIDWLEYVPESDSVHVIDFKTSKREEREESLQLPIYVLLAQSCQDRQVKKVSYWYLSKDDAPREQDFPDSKAYEQKILAIAKKIVLARKLQSFPCPHGEKGCVYCRSFEMVARGNAECVGVDQQSRDIYLIDESLFADTPRKGEIL